MDEPKFCVLCGVRPVGDGRVKTCSPECWEVFHGLVHMEWPVVLGHAIARFVRRATVADLVEQIRQIHDGDCSWWEDAACDCSIRGHLTALSRLARLAGGGA